MNLLADEGVDKQIVVRLREEGYSVSYVDPRKILDPQRLMPKNTTKLSWGITLRSMFTSKRSMA